MEQKHNNKYQQYESRFDPSFGIQPNLAGTLNEQLGILTIKSRSKTRLIPDIESYENDYYDNFLKDLNQERKQSRHKTTKENASILKGSIIHSSIPSPAKKKFGSKVNLDLPKSKPKVINTAHKKKNLMEDQTVHSTKNKSKYFNAQTIFTNIQPFDLLNQKDKDNVSINNGNEKVNKTLVMEKIPHEFQSPKLIEEKNDKDVDADNKSNLVNSNNQEGNNGNENNSNEVSASNFNTQRLLSGNNINNNANNNLKLVKQMSQHFSIHTMKKDNNDRSQNSSLLLVNSKNEDNCGNNIEYIDEEENQLPKKQVGMNIYSPMKKAENDLLSLNNNTPDKKKDGGGSGGGGKDKGGGVDEEKGEVAMTPPVQSSHPMILSTNNNTNTNNNIIIDKDINQAKTDTKCDRCGKCDKKANVNTIAMNTEWGQNSHQNSIKNKCGEIPKSKKNAFFCCIPIK